MIIYFFPNDDCAIVHTAHCQDIFAGYEIDYLLNNHYFSLILHLVTF